MNSNSNMYKCCLGLCYILILTLTPATANEQEFTLNELLTTMEKYSVASNTVFHSQIDTYLPKSSSYPKPILFQRINVLTDSVRTKIDSQTSPTSFGNNPDFKSNSIEVYDGELYKRLMGIGKKSKFRGTITNHDSTKLKVGQIFTTKILTSFLNESQFIENVSFDSKENLYYIQSIPEHDTYMKFWMDPEQGFNIVKTEIFVHNMMTRFTNYELQKYEEIWIPKKIQLYHLDNGNQILGSLTKVTKFELNPEYDPNIFTLNFPADTTIRDLREDKN